MLVIITLTSAHGKPRIDQNIHTKTAQFPKLPLVNHTIKTPEPGPLNDGTASPSCEFRCLSPAKCHTPAAAEG